MTPGNSLGRWHAAKAASGSSMGLIRWLAPILIFLVAFLAFFPSLQNEFLGWDDHHMLVINPDYRGVGWTELSWMFTTFYLGHYQPLSWLTLALDYLFWGVEPFGYHLTNLVLHAANAVLFYFLALRLFSIVFSVPLPSIEFGLRTAAGFAAFIFAIHPLRVESVAWATERRDVLSGFFFLATILCYLRAMTVGGAKQTRLRWTTVAVIVYGLSLLSKASGMTLPIVLLVLDVYPLRRLGGGAGRWFGSAARLVWLEKIPFFLLALGTGVIAWTAQFYTGAVVEIEQHGPFARLAQTLFGLAFYLWKTIVPIDLSPLYELPAHINPLEWPFLLSGAIVFGISGALLFMRQRWPAALAVWIFYVAVLGPVLGIAQSGPQMVADRYTYLSCLGWALMAGAGFFWCWRAWVGARIGRATFILATGTAVSVLVALGVLTWRQTRVWHDTESLWRHVLAVSHKSTFQSGFAHHALGFLLAQRGDLDGAIEQFSQALQINPNLHENLEVALHNDLGAALERQGKLEEATRHYEEAVRIRPDSTVLNNLGKALARQGRVEEAVQNFRAALRISPDESAIHFNLGNALVGQGQLGEATEQFEEAVRIRPDYAEAHHNLGKVVAARGYLDKAVDHFRQALQIQPDFAEAHESLGRALSLQGKRDEAIQHYQEALRILKGRSEAGGGAN